MANAIGVDAMRMETCGAGGNGLLFIMELHSSQYMITPARASGKKV
ncbi:MAG: hypothetical protein NC095_12105 [Muribaculum sp.]|nr:hypothetical protein [Muribaculum sp.]